jgi:hypothetical protein
MRSEKNVRSMNPYLIEVRVSHTKLTEMNEVTRLHGSSHEAVVHHRGGSRLLLLQPRIGPDEYGHDHVSAQRHVAAGNRPRHAGCRDGNSDGSCRSNITCGQFGADLPDRRKQHGMLDIGDAVNGNVRLTLQL